MTLALPYLDHHRYLNISSSWSVRLLCPQLRPRHCAIFAYEELGTQSVGAILPVAYPKALLKYFLSLVWHCPEY